MMKLSLDLGEMQKVVGDVKNIKNFTQEFCKKLVSLNVNQFQSLYNDMEKWDKQPYNILFNALSGCCEQCPFCGEQCELTDPNHTVPHSISLHLPQCLGGWMRSRSKKMVVETCNILVASGEKFYYDVDGERKCHSYSRFQELQKFSSWTITPDSSLEASLYWKWFLAKYTSKVAQRYQMKEAEIPDPRKSFTLEQAKESIKQAL